MGVVCLAGRPLVAKASGGAFPGLMKTIIVPLIPNTVHRHDVSLALFFFL